MPQLCSRRKVSISARCGAEACAPILVTESAAAALANRTASPRGRCSTSATAREPLNTSPAAVVSTASTRQADTSSDSAVRRDEDSARAQRHEHIPDAPPVQRGRGARQRRFVAHVHGGQLFGLAFVRRDQRQARKKRIGKHPRRRGIQDESSLASCRQPRCRLDSLERNLELQQNYVARAQDPSERLDVLRTQLAVGSRRHGDAVLPLVVHADERDAGRCPGHTPDEIDVDVLANQILQRPIAEVVRAERSHENDGSARASRGDSLVRPFAACRYPEIAAESRLARRGDPGDPDGHVGIRAADDNDSAHFSGVAVYRCLPRDGMNLGTAAASKPWDRFVDVARGLPRGRACPPPPGLRRGLAVARAPERVAREGGRPSHVPTAGLLM